MADPLDRSTWCDNCRVLGSIEACINCDEAFGREVDEADGRARLVIIGKRIAKKHRMLDPDVAYIFMVAGDELRLIEVTASVGDSDEAIPVRFAARPELGTPIAYHVMLLAPTEWDRVREGVLALPEGWSLDGIQEL